MEKYRWLPSSSCDTRGADTGFRKWLRSSSVKNDRIVGVRRKLECFL